MECAAYRRGLTAGRGGIGQSRAVRTVLVCWRPVAAEILLDWAQTRGHEVVLVETTKGRPSLRSDGWKSVLDLVPFDVTALVARHPGDVAHVVEEAAPDLLVCFTYPHLLDARTIGAARVAALNVHPGRLPEYRGPNPLWALYRGDAEIDVTVHRIAAGFDTGNVMAVSPVFVDGTLSPTRLRDILASVVPVTLDAAVARALEGDPGESQPAGDLEVLPVFTPADGELDWDLTPRDLMCRWTACDFGGVPITVPMGEGRRRVTAMSVVSHAASDQGPGTVLASLGRDCLVAARDGIVLVEFAEPALA